MSRLRVFVAALLLAVLVSLATRVTAEEPAEPAEPPARGTRSIQVPQRKIGQQIERTAADIGELLQEALQNIGVELKNREKVKDASSRLEDVGRRVVPKIIADLREGGETGLRAAFTDQDHVARELSALLLAVQGELAPAATRRALSSAIAKQTEALERTRDTRVSQPQLEGKAAKSLTEDEKRGLSEAAEKQGEAADEILKARHELSAQSAALQASDPAAAGPLRQALKTLDQTETPQQARDAVGEIAENRLRRAEEKQENVLAALKQADARLAQKPDCGSQLQDRLARLEEAAKLQVQALDETRRLDPHSEEALAKAIQDQGGVSKQLKDLKAQNPALDKAHQQSETAKAQLVQDQFPAATRNEEAVLQALQEAIQKAAQELAQTQNQEEVARDLAARLDQLAAMTQKQQDLLNQTQQATPQDAHGLARPQEDLAGEARQAAAALPPAPPATPAQQAQQAPPAALAAQQAAPSSPQASSLSSPQASSQSSPPASSQSSPQASSPSSPQAAGPPSAQSAMQQAGQSMQQAAQALANQQPAQAVPAQQQALQALQQAAQATAAQLAQVDPAAALQAAQQQLNQLAQQQDQLAQQTVQSSAAQVPSLAPQQSQLGQQAQGLAQTPGVPSAAQAAMSQAAQAMSQAAQAMQQGQPSATQQAQGQAQAALGQAQSAMSQAAGQMPGMGQAPVALGQPAPALGLQHSAAKGSFQYGKVNAPEGPASWDVALPPRERAEVEQALKEKLPARYRRQIALYYQSLANTGRNSEK